MPEKEAANAATAYSHTRERVVKQINELAVTTATESLTSPAAVITAQQFDM
ncbi:MAG: hypothetical protein H0T62_06520 [Parachlamydiaceae bacterium]|nr:hypothetical protein [Parachlamydiaceae bacterium]